MNRRRYFLASMGLVSLAAVTAPWRSLLDDSSTLSKPSTEVQPPVREARMLELDSEVKDHLSTFSHFDQDMAQDIFLPSAEQAVFQRVLERLRKIQAHAGYANFSLMSFDELLKYARSYSVIGLFSADEIQFMEKIFFHDAHDYGFFGEKVISSLTAKVVKKDIIKIRHSGNYLFRGGSQAVFKRLKKDIGDSLILTSGIRSVVKQMYLFLAKAQKCNGNLSRASRSLAPPGHSYHALGDFDVGKRDFGALNFTARFAQTEEYHKLIRLGYVSLRYTQGNYFGVRYEPWHIKVV
ncbi:MAG TPA: peptidase M15 [Gammaproteobacteria bacterium]|nr:peptidase M15 [Gammaproteobacteria bacterium]